MSSKIMAALVVCLAICGMCAAQPAPGDATKGNDALHQRVENLEKELKEIRQALMTKDAKDSTIKRFALWSSVDVQLYGYIKLDAAYDTSRTSAGNFPQWVVSEQGRQNDGQFNMTARQTRLGLRFKGPDFGDGGKTSGVIEVDFYGAGVAENKPELMMRHAYMKLDWPKHKFSILAGQTSDVISPLYPSTVHYSILWWVGNLGYRRPQIRLTKGFDLADDVELEAQFAVLRNIGRTTGFDPGDSGEDNCYPSIQGRTAVTFPLWGGKKTTIGVSGHFAKEEYDYNAYDDSVDLCSWSANGDLNMPVNDWLTLKGEIFTGQDLDAYLGGIGQGVSGTGSSVGEVRSCGGWLAASLGPWDKWKFNLGAGTEYARGVSSEGRTGNLAIFGNVFYQINKSVSTGFEVSHWHTQYRDLDSGHSLRLQWTFIYGF